MSAPDILPAGDRLVTRSGLHLSVRPATAADEAALALIEFDLKHPAATGC